MFTKFINESDSSLILRSLATHNRNNINVTHNFVLRKLQHKYVDICSLTLLACLLYSMMLFLQPKTKNIQENKIQTFKYGLGSLDAAKRVWGHLYAAKHIWKHILQKGGKYDLPFDFFMIFIPRCYLSFVVGRTSIGVTTL